MNVTRENTEIISVAITPKKVFVKYAIDQDGVLTNFKAEYLTKQKPIHADFRKSIENLDTHLLGAFFLNPTLKDRVSVSGMEIQMKNNQDSVKIYGFLCMMSGNLTPIKTDFIRFEQEQQKHNYDGVKEIDLDVNIVREESFRYLFEDKTAQLKIPFDTADNTNEPEDDASPIEQF
jgi:hypothetical protein